MLTHRFFDLKLNPYQLTVCQLQKKMKKYKEFLIIEKSREIVKVEKKDNSKKKRKQKTKKRLREKLL